MRHISRATIMRQLARATVDFSIALGVIWALSLGTTAYHGRTFVLLSFIVASIAAFDLAFLRYLRRVYASPRRGMWRRV